MGKKTLKENVFFILIRLLKDFFVSLIQSLRLFIGNLAGSDQRALKENAFLDAMNFFFHTGPKSFWKAPSGIKIGRSIGTFLHYIFKKDQAFLEKKNK
ncbi:MAG: hypothetical protein PHH16_02770 [Candidatus Gracilibacteria bacterium]|nr:hypothetical protein [Candidatus Gracilibacteria bacterium]